MKKIVCVVLAALMGTGLLFAQESGDALSMEVQQVKTEDKGVVLDYKAFYSDWMTGNWDFEIYANDGSEEQKISLDVEVTGVNPDSLVYVDGDEMTYSDFASLVYKMPENLGVDEETIVLAPYYGFTVEGDIKWRAYDNYSYIVLSFKIGMYGEDSMEARITLTRVEEEVESEFETLSE